MCGSGLQLESHTEWVTARSRTGILSGCWMFEVQVQSGGLQQIGWVTSHCHLSDLVGVGETPFSFAFDGVYVHL